MAQPRTYLAIIILTNSSYLIWPSPSTSASRIISSTSSSVSFSPKLVITWRSSAALMKPLPSRSKTLKASINSSSIGVLHLPCHQRQELRKVNSSITIRIHLVDHVLELGLSRVLAQRPHHGAQLPM